MQKHMQKHKQKFGKFFLVAIFFLPAQILNAACLLRDSSGQVISEEHDPLFALLKNAKVCPVNVADLKSEIEKSGLDSQPYMVANRGIQNPVLGSFSFFESVKGTSPTLANAVGAGEFFFGHFTAEENGVIVADQSPTKGKLLIELIAWDISKSVYNFYELIGTGSGAQWFYRGDSLDILNDNRQLYLNPLGPKFGHTLRCSGCHMSGGPIMKEVAAPRNDWWTESRHLDFSPHVVSPELSGWLAKLNDASGLSADVQVGIAKLEVSPIYRSAKYVSSLQIALRPLFCETEINLESDIEPFASLFNIVQIPSASLVNPALASGSLSVQKSEYVNLLRAYGMNFPETQLLDADHAWLVPVKGISDLTAIQSLVSNQVVNEEFVADVLAVDFKHPVLSTTRCNLLKLVSPSSLSTFTEQLRGSALPGAAELLENLTNPARTKSYHKAVARTYLSEVQKGLQSFAGREQLFKRAIESRRSEFNAEISKNPRGQILEPGFRIIFPEPRGLD